MLRIDDQPNGFAVDIEGIAPLLPTSAERLLWSLDDANSPAQLVAIDVDAPEIRMPYPYSRMQAFWKNVTQTIWGTYVAAEDEATLAAFSGDYLFRIAPDVLMRYPFLLQAVDSSFFLVHSTDMAFLNRVEESFKEIAWMSYQNGNGRDHGDHGYNASR